MKKSIQLTVVLENILDTEKKYPYNHRGQDLEYSKQAHAVLSKQSNDVLETNPNFKAIKQYTNLHHALINELMRNDPEGLEHYNKRNSTVSDLKAYTKNTTSHTFKVYRGSNQKITDTKPGTLFKDNGFVSTSLSPNVADDFSSAKNTDAHDDEQNYQQKFDPKNRQRFRIHVTPGTRGFYVGSNKHLTDKPEEREFLLHPGTTFRVGQTRLHKNGKSYTDLHIHSQED